MNLTKEEKLSIFENAICLIVVFAMYVYGFGKIIQFGDTSQNHLIVSKMTGMQLMWAFYGYSQSFAMLLGLFEVIGGTLILIPKTRLIGCLFTSTILVNVILQDIFYKVNSGALRAAIIYQSLILIVLWLNRNQVFESFKNLLRHKNIEQVNKKMVIKIILTILLFIALRFVEYFLTSY